MNKPDWWPKNPYPADIFPMKRERYPEIVPDLPVRTALSGMLGREFWDIASEMIWKAYCEQDSIPELITKDPELQNLLKNALLYRDERYDMSCASAIRQLAKRVLEKYGVDIEIYT